MAYRLLTLLFLAFASAFSLASCEPEPTAEEIAEEWVRTTLDNMSRAELVSQLFIVALPEESIKRLRYWVTRFKAGGIVLFDGSPLIQSAIVSDLQNVSRIPLLVAQDAEWGAAMRVEYATEFPRAMGIAATDNPRFALEAGRITATEALSVGVNLILAPVADVISDRRNPGIGMRSFGDSPGMVSEYTSQFIQGVQSAGALATIKHNPGYGATSTAEQNARAIVDTSRLQTDSLDLLPIRTAIETGVAAVMSSHVAYPDSVTTKLGPATLSGSLPGSLLRDRLGFGGLIISDALNLVGVEFDEPNDVAVRALEAGVDLLLVPPNPEAAYQDILSAIQAGRISENRLRESVERILRAKAAAGLHLHSKPDLNSVRSVLTRPEHRSLASEMARRSIVLLANEDLVPLSNPKSSIFLISLEESNASAVEKNLIQEMRRKHEGQIVSRVLEVGTWRQTIDRVVRDAREHDILILADQTSEYRPQPNTIRAILDRLASARRPIILAGMGSPYSLSGSTGKAGAVLVSFGSARVSSRALADILFGESPVCGRLPIQLSNFMPRGFGLCLPQSRPRRGYPGEVGMNSESFRDLDSLLVQAIADSAFPGAAIAIGRANVIVHLDGYGRYTYESGKNVTAESLFDLASLTKVIATTTAMMQLYEAGLLSLDDPVSKFIPDFAASGKRGVTIRHLLTHTSGLIPFRRFYEIDEANRDTVLARIMADSLVYEPEAEYRYSDFGPIMLGIVVENITGQAFDDYSRLHIFEPLGMYDTGFRKVQGKSDPEIVPTEVDDYFRNQLVQGDVHDENAYLLGGTAGHAGLFSSARDLAKFAYMLVNEGRLGDQVFLRPETIRLFTTAVDPEKTHTRALGWDTRSPVGYSSAGSHFGPRAFGHTGFTGTSIWIDPDQALYVVLLTNRVYPSRNNRGHIAVRPSVADLVFSSIRTGPLARFFDETD